MPTTPDTLGTFLRDRRSRIQPRNPRGRRRTPGLRREEVATRAGVSVTWYTWLEQGRGGPPSEDVLERLARALELDAAEREVLFLLAQNRPPPLHPSKPCAVSPTVQHVLDSLSVPAFVKTPAWDIVAWNRAATILLTDYAALPPRERNAVRRIFNDPEMRRHLPDWEDNARFMVSVLRVEVARAGRSSDVAAIVAELEAASPEFRRLWSENGVRNHGAGIKRINHRTEGMLELEYAAFNVDAAEGLTMIVYTPVRAEDAAAMERALSEAPSGRGADRRAARVRGASR